MFLPYFFFFLIRGPLLQDQGFTLNHFLKGPIFNTITWRNKAPRIICIWVFLIPKLTVFMSLLIRLRLLRIRDMLFNTRNLAPQYFWGTYVCLTNVCLIQNFWFKVGKSSQLSFEMIKFTACETNWNRKNCWHRLQGRLWSSIVMVMGDHPWCMYLIKIYSCPLPPNIFAISTDPWHLSK